MGMAQSLRRAGELIGPSTPPATWSVSGLGNAVLDPVLHQG